MAKTCPHLAPLEQGLRAAGIPAVLDGKSWYRSKYDTSPGWGWVYFKCLLDRRALEKRFDLGKPVHYQEYDGRVAGCEAGFYCQQHDSAVVAVHRNYASGLPKFT